MTYTAERVEAACGFERGGMLPVRSDQTILVKPSAPDQLRYNDLSLLFALLNQSGPELRIFLVGEDAV